MQMHKGALALGVTAALSTIAVVRSMNADATSGHKLRSAAGPSHGQPHFKYPQHSRPSVGGILFDQSGTAAFGAPSQNFESSLDQYDAQGADDFVVSDAAGWTVSAFNFQILPSTSPAGDPTTATYDIEIFPDAGGVPDATAACSYPTAPGVADASVSNVSVSLPSPCVLAQGTYWISMVVNLDYNIGGQIFWSDNSSGSGANAKWQNAGGGFTTTCSTWSDLASCGASSNPVGGGQTAFLFQVIGSVGATAGCVPGGLCLVSTVGTDMTPNACATTDTLDATVGDQLNFCYTITNNTAIELDYQSLQNNIDGVLLNQSNIIIPAGGTFQYNHIATVSTTNTYTSTWAAWDVLPTYLAIVESAGGGICSDRIFADGFEDPTPCTDSTGFVDITQSGVALGLGDDDTFDATLPFSFNFYGATSNFLTISNNGGAIFGVPGSTLTFDNQSLPALSLPGPAMFPLWDDFDSVSGDVYTDTRGAAPNRQFIVEWFDRVHYGSSNTDGATFELILNESGTIQFEYLDVDYSAFNNLGDPDDCTGGLCATIGLQGGQTLFNQFSAFEAAVTNGSGIQWTPNASQVFFSSDSTTVTVGAPQIVVNANPLVGSGPPGAIGMIPFSIENHGNRDLNWSLDEALPSILHFPPPGSRFSMPLGDPSKASLERAPIASRRSIGHKPTHNAIHVPLAGAVPAFGADIFLDQFETFDVLTPSSIDIISPVGGQALVGGAFIDGDFAKLYAISGNFGNNQNQLVTVDPATGATTFIADATNSLAEGYSGLAYDTSSGVMYAASSSCGSSSHLWTIDPNTGATTLVGQITGSDCIVGIAIDAQGEMYGIDIINDSLIAIDKSNANAAIIGSVGFNMNYAQDMAFDLATGILYLAGFDGDTLADDIYTVDLLTGTASVVGPIGNGTGEIDAMGIETVGGPCALPQDLPWLSLSPLTGTTPPNSASPGMATIDATGANAGDVLAGTVCATSNDPQHHSVAVPIEYDVQNGPQPPPTLAKAFAPADITAGQTSTLTITLANSGSVSAPLTSNLTDALPAGMTVAATPNASTTCGGALTAAAGTDSVVLDQAGASIPALSSCDIMVDVETAAPGSFANSIPVGALQTQIGSNAASADATLLVDAPLVPPTVGEQFNPTTVPTNTPSTLTITLGNQNATPAVLTAPFTDAFPPGLVVAPTPNASTTCGGQVIAVANDIVVTLDSINSIIPATGSCTVQIDVEAANPGTFDNTIVAGTLQTGVGQNAADVVASLTVTPQPVPPTIAKAFSPSTVTVGTPSTLTITLGNGNNTAVSLTAALTDTFPSGLVVATPPNASTTCGGAVTAVAGTDSVTLDVGSAIPASASCTITIDVDSATPASYPNDIPVDALQTDSGNNAAPADATLDVTP